MDNIYQCKGCKRYLIDEERTTHECKPWGGYKIEGSTLWVSDGELWYPLKLRTPTPQPNTAPDFEHPKRSPEDETEPECMEKAVIHLNNLNVCMPASTGTAMN